MPRVDFVVEGPRSNSLRARQLESMFDVPHQETSSMEWSGDVPLEERDWNVGLIVGPSGSGKTQLARKLFGVERSTLQFPWQADSVIDDIAPTMSIDDVTAVCQAVGFNTVTAWLRPHWLLSTGEQFRAQIARALLEGDDPIVVDEFTSVVDRQVAKIASHAVQKYVRRHERQFVAVSCHYDVVDWLQPDWILEPATMTFDWRSVQRRPDIDVAISRVPYSAWGLFAPFHYLTQELHKAAVCYVLTVDGTPAAFSGVLHRPHSRARNIKGVSRTVTLPDWQGLGLAFVLNELVGSAYVALGYRFRMYPAHPPYIRSFDRSPNWLMVKKPGRYESTPTAKHFATFGGRPNATFEYVGQAMDDLDAAAALTQAKLYVKSAAS